MIAPGGELKIYVATRPVSARASTGWRWRCRRCSGSTAFCGGAFVRRGARTGGALAPHLRSKRADRIKVLVWDRTGMVFGAALEPVARSPLTAQTTSPSQDTSRSRWTLL